MGISSIERHSRFNRPIAANAKFAQAIKDAGGGDYLLAVRANQSNRKRLCRCRSHPQLRRA
jgi:hypothetical protein